MNSKGNVFFVYILRSSSNKLYIGQTNNLTTRQDFHRWGVASKFTRQNKGPYVLVYSEKYKTRKEAMLREKQLKKSTRAKKKP